MIDTVVSGNGWSQMSGDPKTGLTTLMLLSGELPRAEFVTSSIGSHTPSTCAALPDARSAVSSRRMVRASGLTQEVQAAWGSHNSAAFFNCARQSADIQKAA